MEAARHRLRGAEERKRSPAFAQLLEDAPAGGGEVLDPVGEDDGGNPIGRERPRPPGGHLGGFTEDLEGRAGEHRRRIDAPVSGHAHDPEVLLEHRCDGLPPRVGVGREDPFQGAASGVEDVLPVFVGRRQPDPEVELHHPVEDVADLGAERRGGAHLGGDVGRPVRGVSVTGLVAGEEIGEEDVLVRARDELELLPGAGGVGGAGDAVGERRDAAGRSGPEDRLGGDGERVAQDVGMVAVGGEDEDRRGIDGLDEAAVDRLEQRRLPRPRPSDDGGGFAVEQRRGQRRRVIGCLVIHTRIPSCAADTVFAPGSRGGFA